MPCEVFLPVPRGGEDHGQGSRDLRRRAACSPARAASCRAGRCRRPQRPCIDCRAPGFRCRCRRSAIGSPACARAAGGRSGGSVPPRRTSRTPGHGPGRRRPPVARLAIRPPAGGWRLRTLRAACYERRKAEAAMHPGGRHRYIALGELPTRPGRPALLRSSGRLTVPRGELCPEGSAKRKAAFPRMLLPEVPAPAAGLAASCGPGGRVLVFRRRLG